GRPDVLSRWACAGHPARQKEHGAKQIEVERRGARRRPGVLRKRFHGSPLKDAWPWQGDGLRALVASVQRRLVRPVEEEAVAANTRRRVLRHVPVAPGGGCWIHGHGRALAAGAEHSPDDDRETCAAASDPLRQHLSRVRRPGLTKSSRDSWGPGTFPAPHASTR